MYAAGFQCAGCGEWVESSVDESAGSKQQYVEDCQVCCAAVCGGLPGVLPAECIDGAVGWLGEGVYDFGRVGELGMLLCELRVQ
jgi:hypothetical protein